MKTIVGLYDDIADAHDVVEELVDAGIDRNDISLIARDIDGTYETYIDVDDDAEEVGEAAAGGAVGGAVVGGLTGLLVGLGALTIPGLGPVVAAGPLAAALTGAAVGAVTGSLLNALVEWGVPEAEAEYYAEGVRRGGTLVSVKATQDQADEVVSLLNGYDPVDVERRAQYWRDEYDWTGFDDEAEPYDADAIAAYRADRDAWMEEFDAEDDDFDFDLGTNGDLDFDEEPEMGIDDDSGRYNEDDEVLGIDFPDFEDLSDVFQTHYDSTYATSAYSYDQYAPAYRYGYNLATDPRYADSDWDGVATHAKTRWEEYNEGTWEEFKDAVHHAWEQVKDAVGAGQYEFGVMDADEPVR